MLRRRGPWLVTTWGALSLLGMGCSSSTEAGPSSSGGSSSGGQGSTSVVEATQGDATTAETATSTTQGDTTTTASSEGTSGGTDGSTTDGGGDGTGGSTGGSTGNPSGCNVGGGGQCTDCLSTSCCPQVMACEGEPGCDCWFDCVLTGASLESCGFMCGFPSDTAVALGTCVSDQCGGACGI